jgi:hypothetical protein
MTCWRSCTSRRSTGARSGAPTRSSGSTRKSSAAPMSSVSSRTTPRSPAWWAASCWSSRRNGSSSAGASSPRPPWQRSRSQKRPWSSPMLIPPPSQHSAPAEAHQRLSRSTQNTSIVELPVQRSGFILDERSCTVSFQAVIPWLPQYTLRRGSQDLLSYTTRRGATPELGPLNIDDRTAIALGAAVLSHHPTGKALQNLKQGAQKFKTSATPLQAQKFPSGRSTASKKPAARASPSPVKLQLAAS